METKISEKILKNSNLDICFELERLFIGVPRHIVGTDLPENCVWADGSFISFANYPKMKYAYDNGWFSGMMLNWDAGGEEQKKNLGMYRPDAAEPTGLFVPNLTNVFLRCWTPTQTDETAGMGIVMKFETLREQQILTELFWVVVLKLMDLVLFMELHRKLVVFYHLMLQMSFRQVQKMYHNMFGCP